MSENLLGYSVTSDELNIDDSFVLESKMLEESLLMSVDDSRVDIPDLNSRLLSKNLNSVNDGILGEPNDYINSLNNSDELLLDSDKQIDNDDVVALRGGEANEAKGGEGDGEKGGEGDGEAETYNVVVNFVFVDGTIVHEPLIATLQAGDDYSYTVSIEQLTGYESYVGNDANPSSSFTINITNIQQNHNYTVTYRPSIVNYTIEYYWQDTLTNTYSLHEYETANGYTGDVVDDVDKQYNGMYALLYDKPRIAADGTTVLRVYYDRYYYLMSFNLSGGYGLDSIYGRYGTAIYVNEPSRAGYTFDSWSPSIPATIPVGGGTYTAVWIPEQTSFNVVYFGENIGPGETYSVIGTSVETALSGSTVSDSSYQAAFLNSYLERGNFTYNTSRTATYVIEGDGSTVVNVYYSRKVATYTFYESNGTTLITTLTGKVGSYFDSYNLAWPDGMFQYRKTGNTNQTITFLNG